MSTVDEPLWLESLCDPGQGGVAGRQAALPMAARQLHRAVLRAFLRDGQPPHRDELWPSGRGEVHEGFRQLAGADLVHLNACGRVDVAYPFSGTRTAHVVWLDGAAAGVHAMCAIDALGIPLMTDRDGIIESRDPDTGEPIRIKRRGDTWQWAPRETVVLLAQVLRTGLAADCLCPTITFHAHETGAEDHLRTHPELTGLVLGHSDAVDIARLSFGRLLTEPATLIDAAGSPGGLSCE